MNFNKKFILLIFIFSLSFMRAMEMVQNITKEEEEVLNRYSSAFEMFKIDSIIGSAIANIKTSLEEYKRSEDLSSLIEATRYLFDASTLFKKEYGTYAEIAKKSLKFDAKLRLDTIRSLNKEIKRTIIRYEEDTKNEVKALDPKKYEELLSFENKLYDIK